MKKVLVLILIMLMGSVLVACGKEDTKSIQESDSVQADTEKEEKSETKSEKIEVDKGLLNVEIKLPASMFEGQDIESVISEAKKDGVDEVTKNDDGSLTYKMSKAKHKEMLKEMQDSILEGIEETKNSDDFVSIKDVTYNKDFSEFVLLVDKEKFQNSFDGIAGFGLGISGMYFQLFNGVNPDNYKVTIIIKDETSGEVLDTVVYPDALNE
ncbi:hypothetical protein ACFVR1_15230 [Psychrobacillus sp. NPDC058041]|uniref:hypothetical protein n=1 Tax=Psychrobacillus sp. NPDC058041 TaxID=3346310 RepID=UPI0036D77226